MFAIEGNEYFKKSRDILETTHLITLAQRPIERKEKLILSKCLYVLV